MVGTCFYYDTPPKGSHLWVVLAPSIDEPNSFVCVNVETRREKSDTTCLLLRGEHQEFTNPESVVVYAFARDLPIRLIDRLQKQQNFPKMGDDVLRRIQTASLTDDSALKNKFKKSIQRHLGMA
jgi:hypothetical protein